MTIILINLWLLLRNIIIVIIIIIIIIARTLYYRYHIININFKPLVYIISLVIFDPI